MGGKKVVVSSLTLVTLLLSLSACASPKTEEPDHKEKTTACLISAAESPPGSPERQLATDLVQAEVVFGLAIKEVKIEESSEYVEAKLLAALQAGCVLMVSSNLEFLDELSDFAKLHKNMIVLFVGGTVDKVNQPANLRWVADDFISPAALAGFFAAGKAPNSKVRLLIQPTFFQAAEIKKSFREGVAQFNQVSEATNSLFVYEVRTPQELRSQLLAFSEDEAVAIFAGKNLWQGVKESDGPGPILIGADLQLGDTVAKIDPRVVASVERNTSLVVLKAVASLLDRKFSTDTQYRVPRALKSKLVELRTLDSGVFTGNLAELLADYQDVLTASISK